MQMLHTLKPRYLSRYSDYATAAYELQFPVGSSNLPLVTSVHGRSLQHTASYTQCTRVFHGHKVTTGADDHNFHTALRETMCAVVTPLQPTPSWRAQEEIYFTLLDFQYSTELH